MSVRHERRAFTLVELLVALATLAVLVGILLPAIGGARANARRTKCQVNLRSFGQALHAYMSTNRMKLPLSHDAPDLVKGHVSFFESVGPFLEASIPHMEGDRVVTGPPYVCPDDAEVAAATGMSYAYVAGSFMADYGLLADPDPAMVAHVTAVYESDPTLPLMRDKQPWHEGGRRRGSNALYFDGRVGIDKSAK